MFGQKSKTVIRDLELKLAVAELQAKLAKVSEETCVESWKKAFGDNYTSLIRARLQINQLNSEIEQLRDVNKNLVERAKRIGDIRGRRVAKPVKLIAEAQ